MITVLGLDALKRDKVINEDIVIHWAISKLLDQGKTQKEIEEMLLQAIVTEIEEDKKAEEFKKYLEEQS